MTPAETSTLRARREAVVKAHIRAEAVDHDIAATLATFRRPRYDVPALGGVVDGKGAVDALLHALLGAFPDFWLREGAYYHSDDAVIVECVFGGTHQGEWMGIPATGHPMMLPVGSSRWIFSREKWGYLLLTPSNWTERSFIQSPLLTGPRSVGLRLPWCGGRSLRCSGQAIHRASPPSPDVPKTPRHKAVNSVPDRGQ